jgi:outer membrane biosynthesis protein TonB
MTSRIAIIVLAVVAGVRMGHGAEPDDAANCASVLEKPAYPRLARLANISGAINTHFTVREDGRADELQLQGHPILAKEVEGAVERTHFPETCRTKTVDVTFEFRLEGEPS